MIIEASIAGINDTAHVEDKYGRKVHRDFDWVSYEKILRGGK